MKCGYTYINISNIRLDDTKSESISEKIKIMSIPQHKELKINNKYF